MFRRIVSDTLYSGGDGATEPRNDAMTKLMLASVYDAFRAANVPDDKARAASEDIAGYDNRLNSIERKLDGLQGEVNLVKWMAGANMALTIAVLARLFLQ